MGMLIYCGMPSRRALATVFNSGPVNNDSNFKIKKTMIGELQEIKKDYDKGVAGYKKQ